MAVGRPDSYGVYSGALRATRSRVKVGACI